MTFSRRLKKKSYFLLIVVIIIFCNIYIYLLIVHEQ